MKFSKRGFTLIEILVASMLLGMLMTILTMAFNSSAIAWRTGRAGNAEMSKARRLLSSAQYFADNAVPRIDKDNLSKVGRVLGPWNKNNIRKRAVEQLPATPFTTPPEWGAANSGSAGSSVPQPWAKVNSSIQLEKGRGEGYLVGVRSRGPDGKLDTKDDINTLPFEVK